MEVSFGLGGRGHAFLAHANDLIKILFHVSQDVGPVRGNAQLFDIAVHQLIQENQVIYMVRVLAHHALEAAKSLLMAKRK